jgi:hypothetical protein
MLFELEKTTKENINKLLEFGRQNHLKLSPLDDVEQNFYLPVKALTSDELSKLIEKGRKSGRISMEDAHSVIRNHFNAG